MSKSKGVLERLAKDEELRHLQGHLLLQRLEEAHFEPHELRLILGQYWHPIHYFPEFLAMTVSVAQKLELRSRVSFILYQELGKGDPAQAHESLYVIASRRAGVADVQDAAPLLTTADLMEGYALSTKGQTSAVGYLIATEMIDLQLVQSLGAAIERASNGANPIWLTVHQHQEHEHVATAQDTVLALSSEEAYEVCSHARDAWARWRRFFDGVATALGWQEARNG